MKAYRVEECVFKPLPETTAWQGEETEHGKEHPEGEQGEDIQEGIHAQEKAKDHQLEKSHSNTSKSNSSYQTKNITVQQLWEHASTHKYDTQDVKKFNYKILDQELKGHNEDFTTKCQC